MKTLPIKATTPAEKLLIRYANHIAILCTPPLSDKDRAELEASKAQIENELLTILEAHFQNETN